MGKRILYIGSLEKTCNSYMRYCELQRMGHNVIRIDTNPFIYSSLFSKFHHHLNLGPGISALNKTVLTKVKEEVPEIIWIDNKPFLQEATLREIRSKWPQLKIINVITDDPTGQYKSRWRLCLKTASYYDVHFVQREVNIQELKNYGANRVEICYRSFDPTFHKPLPKKTGRKEGVVGFVGTHESFREEFIVYLLQNGIEVSITGNDWPKAKNWLFLKAYYKGPSVYGQAYIEALNELDIALHFLRHANRDEQDSRTFEIPACGVFILAEKSKVHQQLFEDGKEAVFFETKEELLEKVKYYLAHQWEREVIATAGHQRCLNSGYSHKDRLERILKIAEEN